MYYFNQILTALNTLKMMSEVVLLQPNSNALNTLTIMSEVVLLQPNSNRIEYIED